MSHGASFHITYNRGFFISYPKQEGKVKLGENKIISIIGEGEVRVRLNDSIERMF